MSVFDSANFSTNNPIQHVECTHYDENSDLTRGDTKIFPAVEETARRAQKSMGQIKDLMNRVKILEDEVAMLKNTPRR